MKILTLYSRPGCHLCDELAEQLVPLIRGRATVEVVDIDGDGELKRRYGIRIPVLIGSTIELSGYPLDVDRVTAYLESADY